MLCFCYEVQKKARHKVVSTLKNWIHHASIMLCHQIIEGKFRYCSCGTLLTANSTANFKIWFFNVVYSDIVFVLCAVPEIPLDVLDVFHNKLVFRWHRNAQSEYAEDEADLVPFQCCSDCVTEHRKKKIKKGSKIGLGNVDASRVSDGPSDSLKLPLSSQGVLDHSPKEPLKKGSLSRCLYLLRYLYETLEQKACT